MDSSIYPDGISAFVQDGKISFYVSSFSIPQVQFQNNILGGDIEAQQIEPGLFRLHLPDRTTAEHNTGRPEDNMLMSGRRNIDPLSFEILSPPDGPEQNTGTLSSFAGPILSFRTNRMGKLVFVSSFNLVSSAMMATVNYFQNDLQGVHETFWKAQHIVSFGVPIVVSASTLLSSSLFASDPERWSNWITGLLSVNAGMIAGGPLAFYFMRNQGTKN